MSHSRTRTTCFGFATAASLSLAWAAPALAQEVVRKGNEGSFAQPGELGVGLGAGTLATGVTAKYFFNSRNALQALVGVYGSLLFGGRGYSGGVDYIREMPTLLRGNAATVNWNFGAGAGVISYSHQRQDATLFSLSGVLGLGVQFRGAPLEVVAEWRPSVTFGQYQAGAKLSESGGALRWYF